MSLTPNVSTKIRTSKKFAEILAQINHTTVSKSVSSTRHSVKILTHAQTAVEKTWSNAIWDAHVTRIALMVARALSGVNIQLQPLRLPRRRLPLQPLRRLPQLQQRHQFKLLLLETLSIRLLA